MENVREEIFFAVFKFIASFYQADPEHADIAGEVDCQPSRIGHAFGQSCPVFTEVIEAVRREQLRFGLFAAEVKVQLSAASECGSSHGDLPRSGEAAAVVCGRASPALRADIIALQPLRPHGLDTVVAVEALSLK